jgi:hypothetical protein
MIESQKEWGKERLANVANHWGVSPTEAARILLGPEFLDFWSWVNADEFLWDNIEDTAELVSAKLRHQINY